MRNRDYKQYAPDEYYHIYNRGNAKQDIFRDQEDFTFFLMRLRQNLFPKEEKNLRLRPLPPNSFNLVGYCIMPNHFHFLIGQKSDIPTSKLLAKVCTSYSIYYNKKYHRVGHVFQDQFKQVLISSNEYLLWLSAYIHANPLTAHLVTNTIDYPWSSYREYVDATAPNALCQKHIILDQFTKTIQGASLSLQIRNYRELVDNIAKIIAQKKKLERLLLD